jgi:hypothetical protein
MRSGHVSSDRLGEAAQHASLDSLRGAERLHVESCDHCKRLYAGYRLTDRLLSANWRQAVLPPSAMEQAPIRTGLLDYLRGLELNPGLRAAAPAALAVCLVALVAFGVLLPQLMPLPNPAASSGRSAVGLPTPSFGSSASAGYNPTASAAGPVDGSPAAQQSSGSGPGATAGSGSGKTPNPTATSSPETASSPARLPGWPVAWAPDGAHLMAAGGSGWITQRQIQILDASGRLVGSFNADSASWFNSNTIAATSHGKGPGGFATLNLVGLNGHVTATLAGKYGDGGPGASGAVLLGSGTGLVAIASKGDWGQSQSMFVIWDGQSAGSSHAGMPIAFSRDGKKLAVLHPSSGPGSSSSGWLEILSVPGLNSIASYSHTTLRVANQGNGPGYAPDVAFSPDGNWLYAAGTLVDLSRGSTTRVGNGGWLPDGTLLTSNGGAVLRWQGTRSTPDARFASGGSVATSRHGDVVEYFADGRSPLLVTAGGTIRQLNLLGVASLGDAQLAPSGGAIAFTGRSTAGGKVTAVARLN